jgi:membrane protein required for colicin V production
MTVDLALLILVLVFAIRGAVSGAARQIAGILGLIIAYLSAGPGGRLVAPWIAEHLKVSAAVSLVAATLAVFVVVLVLARLVLIAGLERIFGGDYRQRSAVDRALGFVLGGAVIAALAWVVLSALIFVQDNVRIGGRRFTVAAEGSKAVQLTRRYNLFDRVM